MKAVQRAKTAWPLTFLCPLTGSYAWTACVRCPVLVYS